MKPNQRTDNRPQGKSGAIRKDDGDARDDDASGPARNPATNQPIVQYSPSGELDGRRDDDVEPSPEGPNTRNRDDSDVEGLHDRPTTNIERG